MNIVNKKKISETKLISHLIKHPIEVKDFTPFTRDEAHHRKL
jgi:hypothetical protein